MKNINSKSYKKIILIVLIFSCIIIAISFSVYAFVKNNINNALKTEIFNGLKNSDISYFTDNKFYNSFLDKFQKNDYKVSSEISLSTTMKNNILSDVDLSKFKFNYNISKNIKNNISYHTISTKYGENKFLTVDFVNEKKSFGIKSDEIVNRYVGLKKSNLQKVSDKILEKNIEFSKTKDLTKFILEREKIDIEKIASYSVWENYIDIFKNNINAENILKKENVVVTLENDQVTTTEYTINFSTEQYNSILRNISSTLENDDEIISEFVVGKTSNVQETSNTNTIKRSNSTVEIKAKENKHNATINIWNDGEEVIQNQTSEQTNIEPSTNEETQNTTTDSASVLNQVETNTSTNNTVSDNTITNNTSDTQTTQIDNTISNDIEISENTNIFNTTNENTNTIIEQNTDSVNDNVVTVIPQEEDVQVQEQPNEQTEQQAENFQEEIPESTINENDNYRVQGFISVNEDVDYTGDDDFIISYNFDETFENISKISKNLNWSSYILTGAKANCTKTEMKDYLLNKINEQIKGSNTMILKVYICNNQAVKMIVEIPNNNDFFDIEIASKGSKEKYLNIKRLKGKDDESKGESVSIYKKEADNVNKLKLKVNKIENNKINKKLIINTTTNGNTNSQKYNNTLEVSYLDSNGELKINTSNKVDFSKNITNEELNDENCLFIDNISDDELTLTRDAIKEKLIKVLKQKNQNLKIIDTANSNTIILSNDE